MTNNLKTSSMIIIILMMIISSCKKEGVLEVKRTNDYEVTDALNTSDVPSIHNDQQYSPWVDQLKIRSHASSTSKVVAVVQSTDVLSYEGEISLDSSTIVLRGVAYREPWIKIRTYNDKVGWVFKGAVKQKDEQKGNEPISDKRISFDYFGTFDLVEWELVDSIIAHGELDIETFVFQRGNKQLELSERSMGEFYYGYEQLLRGGSGTILRKRLFEFTIDNGSFRMREEVINTKSRPYIVYSREQSIDTHFYRLNALPIMVRGAWSRDMMSEEEMERFDSSDDQVVL